MYTVLGNGYVFAVGAVSLVCCAAEAPANQHSSERSVRHKQHKNKHPQHPQRVFFAVAAGVFFCCSPHQQPKKAPGPTAKHDHSKSPLNRSEESRRIPSSNSKTQQLQQKERNTLTVMLSSSPRSGPKPESPSHERYMHELMRQQLAACTICRPAGKPLSFHRFDRLRLQGVLGPQGSVMVHFAARRKTSCICMC